jgi:type IV pilus assembly protein PilA
MKSNKGFSLIELIIVIAIMAVLVAIIAPNLTKYLGKSKTSTDKANLAEVKKQAKLAASNASIDEVPIFNNASTGTCIYVIESTNSGLNVDFSGNGTSQFANILKGVLGDDISTKSKIGNGTKISITITGTISGGYDATTKFTN